MSPVRNLASPESSQGISNGVKVFIKNLQKKVPIQPRKIKRAVLRALSLGKRKKSGQISACFVTDKKIKALNKKFHRRNTTTDVLAFDLSEKKQGILADIIISADTAVRNARAFRTSTQYELTLYAVHGVLHLLGYDDRTAKQRRLMQQKVESILSKP